MFETKNYGLINFFETPFNELMQKRIHKVLIVCSEYDSFTLEEDGRIEEQIFNEYVALNLRYPPNIIHATTAEDALKIMHETYIDLVITMLNVGEKFDAFEFAKEIKRKYSGKPVVILTPFSREVSIMLKHEDLSAIDYVFSWLGSADILLAIIKLIEDKKNAETDLRAGVQAVILVEDSIRYYSGFLTNMYKILLTQSKKFMQEGLTEHHKMLRMRGRPKIFLATNYEEAVELYSTYKNNILGIISDTKYKRNGVTDPEAGIRFIKNVKKDNKYLPVILQSSDIDNQIAAKELNVTFLHKFSKNLSYELKTFMNEYFAFGSFQFKDPKTKETIAIASDLKTLQKLILEIPDDSFEYHIKRNHISKWLNARALFPLADFFAQVSVEDFNYDLPKIRNFIFVTISNFRKSKSRGVIAVFDTDKYDDTLIFSRIGNGYMGGKARGLAFLDLLIKNNPTLDSFSDTVIRIPRTVVISTDIFDQFIESNRLLDFALSDISDEAILDRFVNSPLDDDLRSYLSAFLRIAKNPVAVRSSSVLEDSHYQPFAGVYTTYMIPNSADDSLNLRQLETAIKSVYASVYFKSTKAYMKATHNVIDEEKMGIVLQEVCGNKYGERFYPTFSGVVRSVNFYPIGDEKQNEGIAVVAAGLGKHIVEGKKTLRFSPEYPKKILQLSSPEMALRETQKTFDALDLNPDSFSVSVNDGINIKSYRIADADNDNSITHISSVYDYENNILREGKMYKGKTLITFANILKYDTFPLADILKEVLKISTKAMNNPVEIEFAVNMNPPLGMPRVFNLLQIRPIVEENDDYQVSLVGVLPENVIMESSTALGHGVIRDIRDIIYVKPESFDSVNNIKAVEIIEKLNNIFVERNEYYVLAGPGRWGSSDPWLGIPVKWAQICQARLIVESGLENYRVEPSQGTHFFQNLTSFKVGYFTINTYRNDGIFDIDFLSQQEAVYEDEIVRHVRFESDVIIKINGKISKGVVLKPKAIVDDEE
jgi:hypothetical protein